MKKLNDMDFEELCEVLGNYNERQIEVATFEVIDKGTLIKIIETLIKDWGDYNE